MSSISEDVDEHTGLRKRTMTRFRRTFLLGLAFGILLAALAFAGKMYMQQDRSNYPPPRHIYSALHLEGFLFCTLVLVQNSCKKHASRAYI